MCVMADKRRTALNVKPSAPIVAFRESLHGGYTQGRTYKSEQIYHDEKAPESLALGGSGGFYCYLNPKFCRVVKPERVLIWGRVVRGFKKRIPGVVVYRAEYMMYTAKARGV